MNRRSGRTESYSSLSKDDDAKKRTRAAGSGRCCRCTCKCALIASAVIVLLLCLAVGGFFMTLLVFIGTPLHASCQATWLFSNISCARVNDRIVNQIKLWNMSSNCTRPDGKLWQKCLYELKSSTHTRIEASHTTPVARYIDDLQFELNDSGSTQCSVQGFSSSRIWYAIFDYGTNYCNLFNLLNGSRLIDDHLKKEETSNRICTQYSQRNCDVY